MHMATRRPSPPKSLHVQYRSACSGLWYALLGAAGGSVDAVKVGPRGRHLALPDGAVVVVGPMQHGDLVANVYDARWEPIDADDPGRDARIYDCVCRPCPRG